MMVWLSAVELKRYRKTSVNYLTDLEVDGVEDQQAILLEAPINHCS